LHAEMGLRLIRVMAPATTANLGPGYDCLGLALDLWNRLDVLDGAAPGDHGPLVEITGEGAGELAAGPENLVYRAMVFLFQEAGREMPGVRLRCHNNIPLERGLGSSAAAIAGGLVAANALCDGVFESRDLLEMAATIEGHPDNVAAAILGGLQLVLTDQERLYTAAVNVPPELNAVLFIPDLRIATSDARAVLPEKVTMADAVYNMGRAALLLAGMTTNHPEYLSLATQDRLHQPYREALFPAMKLLFRAARDAGALGVFLSGSGSTVLALTRGREMTVAYEMAEAARQAGVTGRVQVTQPTGRGAHIVHAS
jgi:homoserine kinase